MAITIGKLLDVLQKKLEDNPEVKDIVITRWDNTKKPEEQLRESAIVGTSEDGGFYAIVISIYNEGEKCL